jgi:hypothetical protein
MNFNSTNFLHIPIRIHSITITNWNYIYIKVTKACFIISRQMDTVILNKLKLN